MPGKILLIEDDVDQINMYQTEFTIHKLNMIVAKNGEEGLKMAAQEKPDLIMIDLVMEGMGGIEVLEKLKANPGTRDIPAIILTNLETKETVEKANKFGAVEYIVKTRKTPRELVDRVKEIIGH